MVAIAKKSSSSPTGFAVLRDGYNRQVVLRTIEDAKKFVEIVPAIKAEQANIVYLETGVFKCNRCGNEWFNAVKDRDYCECPECDSRDFHEISFDEADLPDHLALVSRPDIAKRIKVEDKSNKQAKQDEIKALIDLMRKMGL